MTEEEETELLGKPPLRDRWTFSERLYRSLIEPKGERRRAAIESIAKLFELMLLAVAFGVAGKLAESWLLTLVSIVLTLLMVSYASTFADGYLENVKAIERTDAKAFLLILGAGLALVAFNYTFTEALVRLVEQQAKQADCGTTNASQSSTTGA